ncbi:MAG TPA: ABC transporter ATP-binding protein [Rhizomicrobium sp.]|nr:ABC transporter ATP-binding protein [Rhizomicrobium sp.]
MTPLIRFEQVVKTYGKGEAQVVALAGVDLEIQSGEFVAVLGPSGSGKSTTMNILGALDTPTSGHYYFNGIDVGTLSRDERAVFRRDYIGFVFQGFNLLKRTTALENLELPLIYRGVPAAERHPIAMATLERVGLADRHHHTASELSGGQQQRVAIARALARQPRFLLLDEPLSALDPQIRGRLRNELKSLQRRLGITTLMVTHDQAEALAIADRIAVMRAGRLLQIGTPQEIYAAPADPFTGAFVGALNLLPAIAEMQSVRLFDKPLALRHTYAPGTKLIAAIRPECIAVTPGSGAAVTSREFQGAFVRLSLQVQGLPLLADVANTHALATEGAEAAFRLPPDHIRLFAAPEAGAARS